MARGELPAIVWVTAAYWRQGVLYSVAILGILGAHEMGHYLACRRYNVDATLPFFLPFPSISGTLGAVIRIREPFPTRTVLFDIAVWGPIGGFLVMVPLLFWGMHLSNVLPAPAVFPPGSFSMGEPLLFRLAERVTFGAIPGGATLNMHPIVFASWFGMLATAWNLLPFGQLDGGHLMHASIGYRSRDVSLVMVGTCIGLCFLSYSWVLMTLVMLAMLYFFGPRHPHVIDEDEPLRGGRYALALFAVVMFILCFTPAPVDLLN
jgi:membrane-associated protease RseP (regulator of RpoE activity)